MLDNARIAWWWSVIQKSQSYNQKSITSNAHKRHFSRFWLKLFWISLPDAEIQVIKVEPCCDIWLNFALVTVQSCAVCLEMYWCWYGTDFSVQSRFWYWSLGSCGSTVLDLVPRFLFLLLDTRVLVQGSQRVICILLLHVSDASLAKFLFSFSFMSNGQIHQKRQANWWNKSCCARKLHNIEMLFFTQGLFNSTCYPQHRVSNSEIE